MGYESRLYVAEKTDIRNKGRRYARLLCRFDLGKCYPLSDILRDKPETNCYVYADDGNTQIIEDCYGRALTETDLKTVINILEKIVVDNTYKYTYPLLETLRVFEKQKQQGLWQDIVVLHYGY